MLLTAGSLATRTVVRLAPPSQTSTGTVEAVGVAVCPGDDQLDRHRGPAPVLDPDLERIARRSTTVSMAWSRRQVSKNQVRQNQDRSAPMTSSKVAKKS